MKTGLVILTKLPFGKRDYDRFGIDTLARYFSVRVLDCAHWIDPQSWEKHAEIRQVFPGHSTIADWAGFRNQISNLSSAVAIDYLGLRSTAVVEGIRKEFKNRNSLRVIVHNGVLPEPRAGRMNKIWMALRRGNLIETVVKNLNREVRLMALPGWPVEFVVLSGEAGLKDVSAFAHHQIWAHSFDYDIYLKLRGDAGKSTEPYAVFLDEDMVHHIDYMHIGLLPPATEKNYYSVLDAFFSRFERATGLRIVIAAHPLSRYDMRPQLLAGREAVIGKTAELVRGASLVFAHASTSVSFAVLWRKPMVFLTTDELQSSFVAPHIALRSKLLRAPLVNMNCIDGFDMNLKKCLDLSESSYTDYIRMYLKRPGTPDRPLWEIFSEYVQQNVN